MTGFFSGTATAMITPFGADGGVNFNSFGEMIERQITAGTDMLVILGTTGEPATMTEEEKVSVMEYSVKKAKGRIKIVFGCGSNCTDHAVSAAKQAEAIGADGLLAVTPYYNKCTQNGLYAYYKSICEAVKIPVIAYNVPSRTGVNIQPATMARIAEIPNMAGIKDAGGNMSQTMEIFRLSAGNATYTRAKTRSTFPFWPSAAAVSSRCFPTWCPPMSKNSTPSSRREERRKHARSKINFYRSRRLVSSKSILFPQKRP